MLQPQATKIGCNVFRRVTGALSMYILALLVLATDRLRLYSNIMESNAIEDYNFFLIRSVYYCVQPSHTEGDVSREVSCSRKLAECLKCEWELETEKLSPALQKAELGVIQTINHLGEGQLRVEWEKFLQHPDIRARLLLERDLIWHNNKQIILSLML